MRAVAAAPARVAAWAVAAKAVAAKAAVRSVEADMERVEEVVKGRVVVLGTAAAVKAPAVPELAAAGYPARRRCTRIRGAPLGGVSSA